MAMNCIYCGQPEADSQFEMPDKQIDYYHKNCAPMRRFMSVSDCADQFDFYAESNPSKDSQRSLRFCAKFLREFCIPTK